LVGDYEPVTDAVPQICSCWVLGGNVESFEGSVFPVFQLNVTSAILGLLFNMHRNRRHKHRVVQVTSLALVLTLSRGGDAETGSARQRHLPLRIGKLKLYISARGEVSDRFRTLKPPSRASDW